MAGSPSQLDFRLTRQALHDGLPALCWKWSVHSMHAENGEFETLSQQATKVWCRKCQALFAEKDSYREDMQEALWQGFFRDTALWWDNRLSKKGPLHPDFRHKKCKDALWLNDPHKPAWVDSQLAMWDAGMRRRTSGSVPTSGFRASGMVAAHEVELEVGRCRKLCEDEQVTEAVEALNLLVQRGCHIPNNLYYRLLKRCVAHKDLVLGRQIHALIVKCGYEGNAFLATHLIGLYGSLGRLEEALRVFSKVTSPSVYNWSSIIFEHATHGKPIQAIALYRQMRESTVQPDNPVFVAVLKACATAGDLAAGKDVHAHILATAGAPDVVVQTCLVDMYAKCGTLEDARRVFDRLSQKNVVTWTAMIARYAQQGMGQEALDLYSCMEQEGITPPNSVTFVCLLQACASVGVVALQQGKKLHAQLEQLGAQGNVVVGNSLVNMYAKCGSLESAQRVFDKISQKDVVTWTAMIAEYAEQGQCRRALSLYTDMQQEGITLPSSVTFVCLLHACATVAALPLGKQLHAHIEELGMQAEGRVGSSLVNMYAKCGSLSDAQRVFDSLVVREVVGWSALIAGYTCRGDCEIVFDLIDRMREDGIHPNSVTFLSVLTVCSHVGLVDKGRKYFEAMVNDYDIRPTIGHYTCMMDLLGRAGHLDEAFHMVKSMPFQPTGAVWRTLLGNCRKWNNVEVGRLAFEFAARLDERDAAPYVLMSSIYAGAEMWEESKEMEARRLKSGAWKQPGQSWWTDMGGGVHTFVVGDRQHPESDETLGQLVEEEGYVPYLPSYLQDIPDYEKEAEICHSQKLAMALR